MVEDVQYQEYINGFRVGRSKKSKILLYMSGLDAFRLENENQKTS